MPSPWWRDLSGAELRARLRQRGVSASRAALLDQHRDNPETQRVITYLLERRV